MKLKNICKLLLLIIPSSLVAIDTPQNDKKTELSEYS